MIQTTHTAITTKDPSSSSPYHRHGYGLPPGGGRRSGGDTHIIPNGIVSSFYPSSPRRKDSATNVMSTSPPRHITNGTGHLDGMSCASSPPRRVPAVNKVVEECRVTYSKQELKERLTPLQYHITQERGTEREYTGEYVRHRERGTYSCLVCGVEIFSSNHKYYSGSGWPSFSTVISPSRVKQRVDPVPCGSTCGGPIQLLPTARNQVPVTSRYEVQCSQCSSHLGHMFDDGPKPNGTRYCINSVALRFNRQVPRETEV